LAEVFASPECDEDIAVAGREQLGGESNALGVAAVLTSFGGSSSWGRRDRREVVMLIPIPGLRHHRNWQARIPPGVCHRSPDAELPPDWIGQFLVGEVRTAIAAADDDEYAEVVNTTGGLRADVNTRLVAVFLAPTESTWVADLADTGTHGRSAPWMYLAAVNDVGMLTEGHRYHVRTNARVLPTLVRTLGPAVAPILTRWATLEEYAEQRGRLVTAVATLPTDEAFAGLLANASQPAFRHVVRRLVWGPCHSDDTLVGAFRLAADRTFTNADDQTFHLHEGTTVGIAHPLHLGAALVTWSALFADHEIQQPFRQLSPAWSKPLPGGWFAALDLAGGIVVGDPTLLGDNQEISRVFLTTQRDGYRGAAETPFGMLDAVSASELLADLTELVGGT
jgi:hypothetical protein